MNWNLSTAAKRSLLLLFVLSVIVLSGCADTENIQDCVLNKRYGFFSGLLHGFITLFTLIVSFFDDDVAIYAVNNTGWWYDFGFYIAVISGFGGISLARRKNNP